MAPLRIMQGIVGGQIIMWTIMTALLHLSVTTMAFWLESEVSTVAHTEIAGNY